MKKKSILIVEDNPEIILAIKSKLANSNYNLAWAQNGKDALELLRIEPDLIWLDIYLPIMDGLEFLEELKKLPKSKDIPVLVVSVSKFKDELVKQVEEYKNVREIIIKSEIKIKDLVVKIEKILSEEA